MKLKLDDHKKMTSGFTADIFALNDERILKLYYKGWDEKYVYNEYNLTKQMASYGIKVPAVYELVDIDGRKGIVYQRLENTTMQDQLRHSPHKWPYYAKVLAQEHYQLHKVTDDESLPPDQQTTYREIIQSRSSLHDTQIKKLLNQLDGLKGGQAICHGDFHPQNLLYQPDGIYIIDWVGALRGNALADVAGTYLIIKVMGLETMTQMPKLKRRFMQLIINLFAHTYLKEYSRLSKTNINHIKQWIPIRAATYLDFGLPSQSNDQLLKLIGS